MISQFISFINSELNLFIKNEKGIDDDLVLFANLNNILENAHAVDNKLIISIVSIEEEKLLPNSANYTATRTGETYKVPAIRLNLVCLFTFYSKSIDSYRGIDLLELVVQYFHNRPILNITAAVNPNSFPDSIENIRAEFVSLNYEQTNYLWGRFGGKYQPSVIYKFKSLPIDN